MTREHLFRGKTISTNEWIYGGVVIMSGRYFIVKTIVYPVDNTCSWGAYEVHPETVGEFTGLLDKDKNKIFEGDILEFAGEAVAVYWNAEAFSWEAKKDVEDAFISFPNQNWHKVNLGWIDAEVACLGYMTTQIIGNIHDHNASFHLLNTETVIDNWEEF